MALLVDVNNSYVNALNARIAGTAGDPVQHCLNWLDAIAPEDVGEIHLAGHCYVSDEMGDTDIPALNVLLDAPHSWLSDDAINNIATYAGNPSARGLKAYPAIGHALAL